MLKTYLRECLIRAARSSWKAANGLAGAAIAGVALIWPGIQKFGSRTEWWTDATNWLGSFVIYAGIAWAILFALQFIFVAPFTLWRDERNKNAALTADQSANSSNREEVMHMRIGRHKAIV
jgi:TRAP-type C4-dicarboxylate transport system permease small subunit